MRIKHLKQKENKPAWMQIAIYWLAKDIYNYNNSYNHQHNNIVKTNKTTSFYHRELIYYIKTQNPKICLQTKTREIYNNILENGSKKHDIFGEKKWKEKIFTLDFSKIWKNTYFSFCQPQTKDLHYKFLHYAIKTNKNIFQTSRDKTDISPNCNYCNNREDKIHLFITCNRIRKIWTHFQPYYKKLTRRNYNPQQYIFTLTANTNSKTKKLTIALTQIIMYEIWITRNNLKYVNVHITQNTIITKIITHLHNIITTHYKIHKTNGTLFKFQQNFCINDAIATIRNNRLQIALTQ